MSLRDEILEQPAAAQRLLEAAASQIGPVASSLRSRPPDFALIAARGSSDNAAIYAQYLFAVRNSLVAALATPSTITLYDARPRMADALVVGISQSGKSPDIVAVVEEGRSQGAITVAVTNDASSPLATAADHVLDIQAGLEHATAATKTYTTSLLAAALLSTALDEASEAERGDLARVPGLMSRALDVEASARELAARHTEREDCIVLGRGFSYPTAREWALKLQELAQVRALPFSAADFEHGPLALAEPDLPVLAVARGGAELDSQLALLQRLQRDHQARLLVVSDAARARQLDDGLILPVDVPEWLSPIVEIIPAQLYTYYLTVARGLDPEQPRTITKVTRTH